MSHAWAASTWTVDLALDANKLTGGRHAELLKLLLDTYRYKPGSKPFQLVVRVDLKDGEKPIEVEVEFLAPREVTLKKNRPKFLEGFRVLQADACGAAFHAPLEKEISRRTVRGASNTVRVRIASLPDFLVMKPHALAGRDFPDGMNALALWPRDGSTAAERKTLSAPSKFCERNLRAWTLFGSVQVVEFHGSTDGETQAMQARRAFELMQQFLSYL